MSVLPSKSFAMVQTGPRQLEARDIAIPDIDDDSAILELEACGICGSDLEQYEGAIKVRMFRIIKELGDIYSNLESEQA